MKDYMWVGLGNFVEDPDNIYKHKISRIFRITPGGDLHCRFDLIKKKQLKDQ